MTESPHYTDHLITALRCLSDYQLARLAEGIFERVKPSKEMDERWFHEAIRQRSEKDQWEACAQRLQARLDATKKPIECKLTMDEKLVYIQKLRTECSACNGEGRFIFNNWREECQPCGGTGKIEA